MIYSQLNFFEAFVPLKHVCKLLFQLQTEPRRFNIFVLIKCPLSKRSKTHHFNTFFTPQKVQGGCLPKWPDPSLVAEHRATDYIIRFLTFKLKVIKQRETIIQVIHPLNLVFQSLDLPFIMASDVMSMTGIDNTFFKGHSTRVANVTKAKSRGASP